MAYVRAVQNILDMEIEDLYFESDGKYHKKGELRRLGARTKYVKLKILFYSAQDNMDDELASQAEKAADEIKNPCYVGDERREEILAKISHITEEERAQGKTKHATFSVEDRNWRTKGVHGIFHNESNSIVIFKEKHGDSLYDMSSAFNAASAFLTVLRERLNDGWYNDQLEDEDHESNQLDLLKSNEIILTEEQEARKIVDMATNRKITGDFIRAGKDAYEFLQDRSEYEYGCFSIETPSVADFTLT